MKFFGNEFESISDTMIKASPPVTVSTFTIMGVGLDLWIQIATGIYIGLLVIDKAYTMYKKFRKSNEDITTE